MCLKTYKPATKQEHDSVRIGYKLYKIADNGVYETVRSDSFYSKIGKINEVVVAENRCGTYGQKQDIGFHIFTDIKDSLWLLKQYKKKYCPDFIKDLRIVEVEYSDTTYIGKVEWWFNTPHHWTNCEVASTMRITRDLGNGTAEHRRVLRKGKGVSNVSSKQKTK